MPPIKGAEKKKPCILQGFFFVYQRVSLVASLGLGKEAKSYFSGITKLEMIELSSSFTFQIQCNAPTHIHHPQV
jgi:hypothetical protein